ncbi:SusC/RagA family TonB-linked outer membrane protein [Carboxylicivirga caseinilyticus]|uniref:SusC/RagA family TonB-linked outer membrane protein n=1 Tax=Carboxylicivirga caseinilyticus TaxID=3417572 RepID=UPI003D33DB1F
MALFIMVPLLHIKAQYNVQNEADTLKLTKDPLVQVAYKKVAKSELLGGVSVVDLAELTKMNYNTYSLDNMQGYIGGYTGNSLWGMGDYLVLVDGIPRDANNVLPTEIEQITFLKGASAIAIYGSRAAKGVIYISTKRGDDSDLSVNVRVNTGWHVAKSFPKYLGSAEYMTLFNEASINDGKDIVFSEETIYNHSSGINPYRYPNVDFYSSDYIKKTYNRTDVITEITGGNKRAKFYSNIGYYTEGDMINFGEAEENNTNRLNIRGNVDLNINNNVSAYINANATFYNARTANASGESNYWSNAATMRPNRLSPLVPISFLDPMDQQSWNYINSGSNIIGGKYFLAGTQSEPTNIFADYYAAGNNKWTSRQFQFDTGIDFDLQSLLKGLSFHTQFAVDYSTTYSTSFNNSYAVFNPVWRDYNGVGYVQIPSMIGNDEKSGNQNISNSSSRQTILASGRLVYETSVNEAHNINTMLIASGWQQKQSTEYHAISNANLGWQFDYNLKYKYYVSLSATATHSARLAEGNRTAVSPSATLAWRLSNENFLSGSTVIDDLRLSASSSILNSDIDIENYYMYGGSYEHANGAYWGWSDGRPERSTNVKRGANEELDFIKRKEISASIYASLWNRLLEINTSVFTNTMDGGIIIPSTIFPSYLSTYYPESTFRPYYNYNVDERKGFDFSINFNKSVGEFDLTLGLNGVYYTTNAAKRDEANEWDYQNRQGQPLDGIWGLQSDGFFNSQDEINNSPEQRFSGTIKPGDIKYIDQNGDNIIDEQDNVYLGKGGWSGAPFTAGINLVAKWKNLTFFALGTGNFGAYAMKNSSYFWVSGNGKYSEVVRARWTEATKNNATYPRLTTESGDNNFRNSDFWLYKTDRFNLAKVQITYDIPKNILQNFVFQDISMYVSGSNLLTISKEREILEMSVGSAPQTRFYNFGIKAVF